MGGPSGSSGTPSNSSPTAVAYQPTAQGGADTLYQALLGGFAGSLSPQLSSAFNAAFGMPATSNPFSSTPGGVSYNLASPFVGGAGSGTITDPNNPLYQQALSGAQSAASGAGNIFGSTNTAASSLPGAYNLSEGGAIPNAAIQSQLAQLLGGAGLSIEPSVLGAANANLSNTNNLTNYLNLANSYTTPSQNLLSNLGGQSISADAQNYLNQFYSPATTAAANLDSYGNSILNTAFDPQHALFNQQQNLLTQQAAAANASAGLGGSAYGASNTANALGNFDINWQNQQLARQAQGLSSAEGAYGSAFNLPTSVLSNAGNAFNAGNQVTYQPLLLGGQVEQGISNLNAQAAQLPASVLSGVGTLGQQSGALASNAAALPFAPTNALESATSPLSSLYSGASTLAGAPYNTQSTQTNNTLSALGNYTNIGNQQFTIPQQLANDLQSYLQLGQAASGLSGQLGALGQQELGSSLSGIGSALGTGSNLLFGNSLGNSGGLLGLAGIGGGGSAAAGLGGLTAGTGALDVGGGGELASGLATSATGAADAGGGFSLGSLLPFGAGS